MSIRYGVLLVPEPAFTARAYRARQLICGQYAAWAAEMHMLHLEVAAYFPCLESTVESLSSGLARIAEESRRNAPQFSLAHRGVASSTGATGNIFLDFSGLENPESLQSLYRSVVSLIGDFTGNPHQLPKEEDYRPNIPLLQYAQLSPGIFADAAEFARAVVEDLQIPQTTRAWKLVLVRFESNTAGDDWHNGRWAVDLRWELLSSYGL